jgi:anti-anti-sigma factor
MLLEIAESRVDDITVLKLTGKLALGREGHRIETMAENFGQDGHQKVIFDITGVNYIDSAAIGMLTMTAGKLKGAGGKLVLVSSPDGRTTQLLKLMQVTALVQLCTTLDEALAAMA